MIPMYVEEDYHPKQLQCEYCNGYSEYPKLLTAEIYNYIKNQWMEVFTCFPIYKNAMVSL